MAQTSFPEQEWENYLPHVSPLAGARSSVAITGIDTKDITNATGNVSICRAVYATVAGNIALVLADDAVSAPITIAFNAGEIKPLQCRRIMATNTTATGIIALF